MKGSLESLSGRLEDKGDKGAGSKDKTEYGLEFKDEEELEEEELEEEELEEEELEEEELEEEELEELEEEELEELEEELEKLEEEELEEEEKGELEELEELEGLEDKLEEEGKSKEESSCGFIEPGLRSAWKNAAREAGEREGVAKRLVEGYATEGKGEGAGG